MPVMISLSRVTTGQGISQRFYSSTYDSFLYFILIFVTNAHIYCEVWKFLKMSRKCQGISQRFYSSTYDYFCVLYFNFCHECSYWLWSLEISENVKEILWSSRPNSVLQYANTLNTFLINLRISNWSVVRNIVICYIFSNFNRKGV